MRVVEAEADPGTRPDASPSRAAAPAKGAWYADPYGKAGERWWDGTKWTREVRGTAAASNAPRASAQRVSGEAGASADRVGRSPSMMPGWYVWNATAMRYWDGRAWQQTRARTAEEGRAADDKRPRWMVRAGYVAAVLLPILGVILGMMVAVRSQEGARAQGVRIILLSVVVFALAVLLSHR